MEYRKRMDLLLSRAESELRQIMADAAVSAEYRAVSEMAGVGAEIARLRRQFSTEADAPINPAPEPLAGERKPVGTRSKPPYPRFFRSGDSLVKVGWSKTNKAEYEHKAPRSVLLALTDALETHHNGGLFSTDQIFPLRQSNGDDVPDYQSYLCLAWLSYLGVVQREGRQGYRLIRQAPAKIVTEAWKTIKER
jgi:hypothetical protein